MKEFFTGTDRMTRAHEVDAMISANALLRIVNGKVRYRKDPILADRWMLDSGAFSQIVFNALGGVGSDLITGG